jgi:hypothetical protein
MRVAGVVGCPACLLATGFPWADQGSLSARAVSIPRTAWPAITPSVRAPAPLRPSVEWPRGRPAGGRRAVIRAPWTPIPAANFRPSAYGAVHEPAQPSPALPVGPPAADQPDQRRHGRGGRPRLGDPNRRPACPGSSGRDPRPASDIRGRVCPWPAEPMCRSLVVRPGGMRHARPDSPGGDRAARAGDHACCRSCQRWQHSHRRTAALGHSPPSEGMRGTAEWGCDGAVLCPDERWLVACACGRRELVHPHSPMLLAGTCRDCLPGRPALPVEPLCHPHVCFSPN